MFEKHWAGRAGIFNVWGEQRGNGERRRTNRRGDDRSELERNRKQKEKRGERGESERERRKSSGGRRGRQKRTARPPSLTPSMVTAEEKTRAFLVITSSAPLFEAQRDKRAAIYWSTHIMATFIYFRPFSFCQGLSSVWAKNRNPRCFTKYQSPPPPPPPPPFSPLYACIWVPYLLAYS